MLRMASKKYPSFSLLLCLTMVTLLLLAQSAEARFRGINPFCKTSDRKFLCTIMVHNATNWHDAVANAINAALDVATRMKAMLPRIKPAFDVPGLSALSRNSAIETCADNFDSAVDNLTKALGYLEAGDNGGMNIFLSAVSVSDCVEAFDQFGTAFPVAVSKIVKLLNKEVSNCLAVSRQI